MSDPDDYEEMIEQGKLYDSAMKKMEKHVQRNPDGTFTLNLSDGSSIGVDIITFTDLKRSLEVTNRMIRRGEIRPEDIVFSTDGWPSG